MPPPSTQLTSLHDIASPDGTFTVVAIDQRNTLKRMYAAVGVDNPSTDELVGLKTDVISALSGAASAFLLDPTYGIPALDAVQARGSFGVLVAAEPAERGNYEGEPHGHRDPEHGAAWVREHGGHALKFLIQLRADRIAQPGKLDLAQDAIDVITDVIADCRAQGVPSVIENLIYPLPDADDLTIEQRGDAIIEAAQALDALRPDLLKLEYPGSPKACRRLADTLTTPWAVLSAGVAFEEFTEVLKVSCDEGGASGFIAGRAVWKDAVEKEGPERRAYLADEGLRRLEGCREAIQGRARPWTEVRAA